jgi:hypothetical protein
MLLLCASGSCVSSYLKIKTFRRIKAKRRKKGVITFTPTETLKVHLSSNTNIDP